MANYTYTDNHISFNNVTVNVKPYKTVQGKIQSASNDYEEGDISPLVNAVEIDWNAAQLGEETISNNCESHCSKIVPSIAA